MEFLLFLRGEDDREEEDKYSSYFAWSNSYSTSSLIGMTIFGCDTTAFAEKLSAPTVVASLFVSKVAFSIVFKPVTPFIDYKFKLKRELIFL